ncbi:hypothetical protein [Billgrantia endophytica]|uniref:hypothetical protein n=1 Tax=Billgrantia endophytica TaxID=2033802 RepID=UPI00105686CF|nr:hypothetical protein [Halomonas endophytica]
MIIKKKKVREVDKPLTQNVSEIFKKNILVVSLLATGFAPTVQAYEQGKQSGSLSTSPMNTQPLSVAPLSSAPVENLTRRSAIERTDSLNRSQQPVLIEQMDRNLAEQIQSTGLIDMEELLSRGIASYNDDRSVMSLNVASKHASSNAFIQMVQAQSLVISAFDPSNDVGTIILVESQRHSDGSATLTMRHISPRYFDRISDGGSLTDTQYQTMIDVLGDNPASGNRTGGRFDHSFTRITANGLMTLSGLVMQRNGGTLGLHTNYNPDVRTWETTSGNAFRKKTTTHIAVDLHPDWMMLVPKGQVEGGVHPMFTIDHDGETILVNGGVTALSVADFASSFPLDEFEIFYDSMTKTSWTGLSLVLVTFVVAFATAGAGAFAGAYYGGLTVTQVAAISAGVVAGVSAASGTLNEGVTTSLGNIPAVTNTNPAKAHSEFGDRWQEEARSINLEGPTSSRYRASGQYNQRIIDDWHHLIDPTYTWHDGSHSFEYRQPDLKVQSRPDQDRMFDNPHDNPNYHRNVCRNSFGLVAGMICRGWTRQPPQGGEA